MSCFSLQLTLPHRATNPLLGMCIFYTLFLLFLCLQFSITIEFFSKPSFTLPDSHTENAVDLLICPREKSSLASWGKTYSPPTTKDCFNTFAICPEDITHCIPKEGLCLPCRHKSDSSRVSKLTSLGHDSKTHTGLRLRLP